MKEEIYIFGVGNNTSVYIDLVQSCGYRVAGLYHFNNERNGEILLGIPIESSEKIFRQNNIKNMNFAISVGDNKIRKELFYKLIKKGGNIPTIIHPNSIVSKYAKLGKGVIVHTNSVIQANVKIGENTVISYNTSITHNCVIGKSCYIATCASVGAYVYIDDEVLIGQAAVVVSGKVDRISKKAVIGAGSVVVNNVEKGAIVAGNPARVIK